MTDLELAYLAGFFDGEGCVSINKPDRKGRMSLLAQVTQTSKPVLQRFETVFGGRIIGKDNGPNRKWCFVWRVYSQEAVAALRAMLPYLMVKREAAIVGIEFQGWKCGTNALNNLRVIHPRRDEIIAARTTCYNQLRVLNKRGVST